MSDHPFTKPINISLIKTPQKMLIVVLPHLIAFFAVLIIDIFPLWVKGLVSVIIVASLYYYFRLHYFSNLKKSIMSIQLDSTNNWYLTSTNNRKIAASLLPSSFISNILIILNYIDINNRKFNIIITSDSLSKSEFRRLRVRLKNTKLLINKNK